MDLDFDFQTQLFLGLHEREVQRWLVKQSPQCVAAIDVGAGEGEYALFFMKKTQARRVWAFEPRIECRAILLRNLGFNGMEGDPRLTLSPHFVGSGSGEQTTLDSLVGEVLLPCVIKVDVDGGELDVLRGANTLLRQGRQSWLVETHSPELERACHELFTEFGYTVRVIRNAWWRAILPEMRPIIHNRWLVAEWAH